MTKTIAIEGMHCQHCVGAVKEALAAVAGVTSVVVSLEKNNAVVEGTGLDDAVLKAAVEDTGLKAESDPRYRDRLPHGKIFQT